MRYYVVDTHFLLENFEQLKEHRESKFIIPKIIEHDVYELSERSNVLREKAISLFKELRAEKQLLLNERNILFEEEINISTNTYGALLNTEDKIIDFAIQLQNVYKGSEVVILSHDQHLLFKSWVSAINVQTQL